MKTKELVKRVKELGFIVIADSEKVVIKKERGVACALIDETYSYTVDTAWSSWDEIEEGIKSELFSLLVEYASTPIEKRKEEKKYYFKLKHFSNDTINYVNYYEMEDRWVISSKHENGTYQTKFTLSELPLWAKEMLEQGHLVKEEVE